MANFKFDVDADGIALVTWDMADRSMNVITMGVIEELGALVEKVATDEGIKGAVITSGKDATIQGADLSSDGKTKIAAVWGLIALAGGVAGWLGYRGEEARMTADLMDDVARLRRRLAMLGGSEAD